MRGGLTKVLRRIYWWLGQWGFDPRKTVRALTALHRYARDYFAFRRGYRGELRLLPSLHDRRAAAGSASSEYFHQDLYVARRIFEAGPLRHVDVGSRMDGFIAHLASFREVEVMDIRPMEMPVPSVRFTQADLMADTLPQRGYCDSLSCLHALEHFGLGRYGDRIDPNGHEVGLRNLAALLRQGGRLYLSVPIGRERVEFNSHRIFNPLTITMLASRLGLRLSELAWWRPGQALTSERAPVPSLPLLAEVDYALGIFIFDKT